MTAAKSPTDRTPEAYIDNAGKQRFVDLTALRAALDNQEATDMGQADKVVAGDCRASSDELESAVRGTIASSRRNISAVLSKYLPGIDPSLLLPRS